MKTRKFVREGRDWELPDTFYRVAIKLIIKDSNDKLLVLKDLTDNSWELPGGGLDHGETAIQTARREINEELGVKLTKFVDTPHVIEPGTHPHNYMVVKLYYP